MNELNFQIEKIDNINGFAAVPIIDDRSLIDIIKEVELKYQKSIAGSYNGYRPDLLLNDLKNGSIHNINKSKVLECECGTDGCWSLLITVLENDEYVKWMNFENIHREDWDYSEIGEFKFEKTSYQKALQKLKMEYA